MAFSTTIQNKKPVIPSIIIPHPPEFKYTLDDFSRENRGVQQSFRYALHPFQNTSKKTGSTFEIASRTTPRSLWYLIEINENKLIDATVIPATERFDYIYLINNDRYLVMFSCNSSMVFDLHFKKFFQLTGSKTNELIRGVREISDTHQLIINYGLHFKVYDIVENEHGTLASIHHEFSIQTSNFYNVFALDKKWFFGLTRCGESGEPTLNKYEIKSETSSLKQVQDKIKFTHPIHDLALIDGLLIIKGFKDYPDSHLILAEEQQAKQQLRFYVRDAETLELLADFSYNSVPKDAHFSSIISSLFKHYVSEIENTILDIQNNENQKFMNKDVTSVCLSFFTQTKSTYSKTTINEKSQDNQATQSTTERKRTIL